MATQNPGYFMAPGAFDADSEQLRRRMAYAQMLSEQGQQTPQGQMVSGHFVAPSWTQHAANLLKSYTGRKEQDAVAGDMQALGDRRRTESMSAMQKYAQLLQGSPASSIQPDPQEFEQSADQGMAAPQAAQIPAQAPNKQAALAELLQSRDPMLQQFGMQQLMKGPEKPQWEKIELPNADGSKRVGFVDKNSPNPISTFVEGGVAPVRLEGVDRGGDRVFVNPYNPSIDGAPTIAATGNPFKDMLVAGPDGAPTLNAPLVQAKKAIAAAGKTTVNNNIDTKGRTEADKKFAGDFVEFATGGFADVQKNLKQLAGAAEKLKSGKSLTGPFIGITPDAALSVANPEAIAVREDVQEVVQRNLRIILGAQFTAKEGEQLIARAFNPRLSEAENAKRVERLTTQIADAAKAKLSASQFFMANGTLTGWEGRLPRMSDFDPDKEPGSAAAPSAPKRIRFDAQGNRLP